MSSWLIPGAFAIPILRELPGMTEFLQRHLFSDELRGAGSHLLAGGGLRPFLIRSGFDMAVPSSPCFRLSDPGNNRAGTAQGSRCDDSPVLYHAAFSMGAVTSCTAPAQL